MEYADEYVLLQPLYSSFSSYKTIVTVIPTINSNFHKAYFKVFS